MEADRERWVAYVKRSLGGRFSYLRGHSALELDSLPDLAEAEKFVASMTTTNGDRRLLFAVYCLIQPDFHAFLTGDLPRLMRGLSHRSIVEKRARRGGSSGHIDWPTTLRLRMTSRPDPSFAVTRSTLRTFDTPENLLIRHFLNLTVALCTFAQSQIGSGALGTKLEQLKSTAQQFTRNAYLLGLRPPKRATSKMRQLAKRHRDARYTRLLELVEQLEAVEELSDWVSRLGLIQQGYLVPITDDDLFELFVLLKVLEVLEIQLGLPLWRAPITKTRQSIGAFCIDAGGQLDVYFDQAPSSFTGARSEYVRIAKKSGLSVSERRPDIALVRKSSCTQVMFVEAKNSNDAKYSRDSVYKALGYLRDFSGCWDTNSGVPKIVLLFPEGSPVRMPATTTEEDLWIISEADVDALTLAIQNFITE